MIFVRKSLQSRDYLLAAHESNTRARGSRLTLLLPSEEHLPLPAFEVDFCTRSRMRGCEFLRRSLVSVSLRKEEGERRVGRWSGHFSSLSHLSLFSLSFLYLFPLHDILLPQKSSRRVRFISLILSKKETGALLDRCSLVRLSWSFPLFPPRPPLLPSLSSSAKSDCSSQLHFSEGKGWLERFRSRPRRREGREWQISSSPFFFSLVSSSPSFTFFSLSFFPLVSLRLSL